MHTTENPATTAWQPIIRARYAHEIDAFVAASIVRELGRHGNRRLTRRVAAAAAVGIAAEHGDREPADASRLAALIAAADWDDGICPAWWPWRAAPADGDEDLLERALEESALLVRAAGSASLRRALLPALRPSSRWRPRRMRSLRS